MNFDFSEILMEVIRQKASDLHLTSGAPPMLRKRGQLVPIEGLPKLTPTDTREIVYTILNSSQRQRLESANAARGFGCRSSYSLALRAILFIRASRSPRTPTEERPRTPRAARSRSRQRRRAGATWRSSLTAWARSRL